MIPDINNIKCGDIVYHALGTKLSVIKINASTRGKGLKKTTVKMVKCRYLNEGRFHIYEFFQNELKLTMNNEGEEKNNEDIVTKN